jgi:hypothetical protein
MGVSISWDTLEEANYIILQSDSSFILERISDMSRN